MIEISKICPHQPLRIIIGAGDQQWTGWIATQKNNWICANPKTGRPAFTCDSQMPSCASMYEHLTKAEGRTAAALCFQWLKPGGYLRCAVPDGNFPDPDYQILARAGGPGPGGHPAAGHRVCYDYKLFSDIFISAGFDVDLLEYCDENEKFHYHQWSADDGPIYRSLLMDHRNKDGVIRSVSLILDARKPTG